MAETPSETKDQVDAQTSAEAQNAPLTNEETAAAIQGVGGIHAITSFAAGTGFPVQGEVHTVEEDVTQELPDGRLILVAAKGTQMPVAQAQQLGLVKPEKATGPSEKKPRRGGQESK